MSGPITRLNAALEGRYRIEKKLGEGGMATVYAARDMRHEREVALKVLKPELAAVVGAERFLAEIKTTASLQHPHILPLFDSGEVDGFLFYVMPYVPGESLRERLDREGQLPVDAAVRIASDLAEALDHAHRQGVIHRDIKPANVLMLDERPMIADFGIALAVGAAGGGRLTETGLSLGTPHYMSPEQATGDQRVGPATDVYALGCVLYEMLVGEPPYTGSTAQAVLGRIIIGEIPSASSQRGTVPANVDGAIRKALEKLPADRFGGAHAFRAALRDDSFRYASPGSAGDPSVGERTSIQGSAVTSATIRRVLIILSVLAVGASAIAAWSLFRPDVRRPPIRLSLDLDELRARSGEDVAISPDGRTFALAASVGDAESRIWVRRADESDFRALPGTEGGSGPSFAPDGRSLVYAAPGSHEIRRTRLAGGAPVTVANVMPFRPVQPFWGDDGRIVFVVTDRGVLAVAETGGDPEEILGGGAVDPYRNPRLLPDGRGLLLTDRLQGAVMILDLRSGESRVLVDEGVDAHYVATGHLLYAHPRGGLRVLPFDPDRLEVTGPSVPVLDGVGQRAGLSPFAVSAEGTLVYSPGSPAVDASSRELVMANLVDGSLESLPILSGQIMGPRFSPDGHRIAYAAGEDRPQIMIYDLDGGGSPRQRTFAGHNIFPVWSPDGTRIAFNSRREGSLGSDLYMVSSSGDEPVQRLLAREGIESPLDWPTRGMLFSQIGQGEVRLLDPGSGEVQIYLGPTDGDGGSASQLEGLRVSSDGELAAYGAELDGEQEIYVRSFPEPRLPTRISFGGGSFPVWGPDDRTVYFWRRDSLFAASIRREPEIAVLDTRPVLVDTSVIRPFWDLHPDGDRAVLVRVAREETGDVPGEGREARESERWIVVVNWFSELRARLETE